MMPVATAPNAIATEAGGAETTFASSPGPGSPNLQRRRVTAGMMSPFSACSRLGGYEMCLLSRGSDDSYHIGRTIGTPVAETRWASE